MYKPVQAGNKGPREVIFYEGLFDPPEEALPRDLQRLKKLIPGYYGVCDIEDRAGETCILYYLEYLLSPPLSFSFSLFFFLPLSFSLSVSLYLAPPFSLSPSL